MIPATSNSSFSTLENPDLYQHAIVDLQESQTVIVRDEFDNIQIHNTDVV